MRLNYIKGVGTNEHPRTDRPARTITEDIPRQQMTFSTAPPQVSLALLV